MKNKKGGKEKKWLITMFQGHIIRQMYKNDIFLSLECISINKFSQISRRLQAAKAISKQAFLHTLCLSLSLFVLVGD